MKSRISISIPTATLQALDSARGKTERGEWIANACDAFAFGEAVRIPQDLAASISAQLERVREHDPEISLQGVVELLLVAGLGALSPSSITIRDFLDGKVK